MGTTSSKPRASQFISRTPFPADSLPLCYHPALPLGPKHLESHQPMSTHLAGGKELVTLSLCLWLLLSSTGPCCVTRACCVLGPGFIAPAPARAEVTAPSRNRNCEAKFPPCPCRALLHFIPAPLPTGSTPNSAFLKGTSIARDDKGAILVNLVSASRVSQLPPHPFPLITALIAFVPLAHANQRAQCFCCGGCGHLPGGSARWGQLQHPPPTSG